MPNVVDSSLFRPGEGPRDGLLAVGLLYEAKGFDVLLAALALLPEQRLRLVGDGPLRDALEAEAARLGVADRIDFHGFAPKEEVAELMRRARLVVVPSRYETSAVVAIEALASGAPSSRVPSAPCRSCWRPAAACLRGPGTQRTWPHESARRCPAGRISATSRSRCGSGTRRSASARSWPRSTVL